MIKWKFPLSLFNLLTHITYYYTCQVLALSETFGRSDQPPVMDPIPGFKTFTCERGGGDKGGGGLCLLYRETLTTHEWTPAVPDRLQSVQNERQWLLVGDKIAFCIYTLHVRASGVMST